MAQQTAVEWLFLMLNNPNRDQDFANKLFEQAKAMEKKQIKKAFEEGGVQYVCNIGDDLPPKAEDYYNKTYQPSKVKPDK